MNKLSVAYSLDVNTFACASLPVSWVAVRNSHLETGIWQMSPEIWQGDRNSRSKWAERAALSLIICSPAADPQELLTDDLKTQKVKILQRCGCTEGGARVCVELCSPWISWCMDACPRVKWEKIVFTNKARVHVVSFTVTAFGLSPHVSPDQPQLHSHPSWQNTRDSKRLNPSASCDLKPQRVSHVDFGSFLRCREKVQRLFYFLFCLCESEADTYFFLCSILGLKSSFWEKLTASSCVAVVVLVITCLYFVIMSFCVLLSRSTSHQCSQCSVSLQCCSYWFVIHVWVLFAPWSCACSSTLLIFPCVPDLFLVVVWFVLSFLLLCSFFYSLNFP